MERLWHLSLDTDNYNDYTCLVAIEPLLECLDIAGAFTLSGPNLGTLIENSNTYIGRLPDGDIYDPDTNEYIELLSGIYNSSVSTAFGKYNDCEDGSTGVVGDGIVGAFDIAVLLWYQFGATPYDKLPRVPGQVNTVIGRTGTASRCNFNGAYNQETRKDWAGAVVTDYCVSGHDYIQQIAPPAPPPSTRRRLDEVQPFNYVPSNLLVPASYSADISISEWLETTNGKWYRIRISGLQLTTELLLSDTGVT